MRRDVYGVAGTEPPQTITQRFRDDDAPFMVPFELEPPTPQQLAAELADRVQWSAWNTKQPPKLKQADRRMWRKKME